MSRADQSQTKNWPLPEAGLNPQRIDESSGTLTPFPRGKPASAANLRSLAVSGYATACETG
jgi:hypothetical protein